MSDRIRFRAWLLGLGPIVVVAGVLAALFVGSGKKPAPHAGAAASEPSPSPPETTAAVPTQPVAVPAPPPPASIPPVVAAAASSLILAGPPPEPIPELDAFWRPKGSEQWTAEQKQAFREQAFQALDDKQRSLEQEVARARRRGDTQAMQEKQATLDYLLARRAQIDAMAQRQKQREAQRDAVLDSGAASD